MNTTANNPDAPRVIKEAKRIPIDQATLEQMRAFARDMGVNITQHTPGKMIGKQLKTAGWDHNYITIDDAEAEAEDEAMAGAPGAVKEPMVTLTLAMQPDAVGGKMAKAVAVNGRTILIPRGVKCEVKLRYLRALEIAIETQIEDHFNPETFQMERIESDAPSVSFQVNRMPSDSEIARWKAWERKQPEWHNAYDAKDAQAA